MPRPAKPAAARNHTAALGFETKLWLAADKLRNNMDAAEYKLVITIRKNVTTDWTVRETARASIRVMVRRILRKHGYPPDLQEAATKTVLAQAELICAEWAA